MNMVLYFSGTVEILAGLGLIRPGLTKIQTRPTLMAGVGLVLIMVGAVVWHVQQIASSFQKIVEESSLLRCGAITSEEASLS